MKRWLMVQWQVLINLNPQFFNIKRLKKIKKMRSINSHLKKDNH